MKPLPRPPGAGPRSGDSYLPPEVPRPGLPLWLPIALVALLLAIGFFVVLPALRGG
ncbi:MAG: hypothetical protein KDI71_17205 [Xanthomonadales bacterium]|nr:hypothetical protein [Xanthomonadales bacterium]